MRRLSIAAACACVCAVLVATGVAQEAPRPATLRAAFLSTNPVQGRLSPQGDRIIGPVGDLMPALARRMNTGYEILPMPNAAAVIAAVNDGTATIGFLAWERERATQVDYSEPYALMGNAYLVLASSPLQRSADVDRPGVVVGAVRGQSQHAWVSEHLRQARVRSVDGVPPHADLVRLLVDGTFQAFAANRQRMEDTAATDARVRVLLDNFSTIPQAMVVKKGSAALLAEINRFIATPETTTLVRESLHNAQLAGVEPAGR
ncbi:MAG: transporter substrate-binding domain-containing protein [Vicinamibacterales bacterium]